MSFNRVLSQSGLTKVELGVLYGVSWNTIHTWSTANGPRPGSYTERMATVITAALVSAMDRKVLPFGAMDKGARRARVAKMAVILQNLKPAAK